MDQGLEKSIDLVIVAVVGKAKKLIFEVKEPGRFSGKQHLPICELFQLDGDTCQLMPSGMIPNAHEGIKDGKS